MAYYFFVLFIGGTYEFIIFALVKIPKVLYSACDLINVLLRGNTACFRLGLNLLSVFVGTGQKEYVIALFLFISGNGIRKYYFVNIADMGKL